VKYILKKKKPARKKTNIEGGRKKDRRNRKQERVGRKKRGIHVAMTKVSQHKISITFRGRTYKITVQNQC
jgi:hypothetical protein